MYKNTADIKEFILREIPNHPRDIASIISSEFGLSRQRAHFYLTREVKAGTVIRIGNTRAVKYFLVGAKHIQFTLPLNSELAEDKVWLEYIKPMLAKYSENVRHIAGYGFTEILNNAIDHSDGSEVWIEMQIADNTLRFVIMDNGVGIFKKIKDALNLEMERESILHLSKGKFTTDPSRHSGQGIFFTSRMFSTFSILSDDLFYSFNGTEWFSSPERPEPFGKGTSIRMELALDVNYAPKDVFDEYSDIETGFHKTTVSVGLSSNPDDPHNSRSQAKRLMAGLDKFKTVVLDFKGVKDVGQAFVDEVFRVFKNEHPEITIEYSNAAPEVDAMIKSGLANK